MDKTLGVPSWRANALAECVVAKLSDYWKIGEPGERDPGTPFSLSDLLRESNLQIEEPQLRERLVGAFDKYAAFRLSGDMVTPLATLADGQPRTLRQRWFDLRRLFENVCNSLFRERRLDALQLRYPKGSRRRARWMDTEDLKFLIGVGQRLLVELCWRRRILLIGVVKDSASRYWSRNLLSVLHATKRMTVPSSLEPAGSDRLICEMIPLIDPTVSEPWTTVEFDALFMTLRAVADENGNQVITGVKGNILAPSDGLFPRCLVQMFVQRRTEKDVPLMGHVLFMDRLANPHFDSPNRCTAPIVTRDSVVRPLIYENGAVNNPAQDIATLVAYLLTRNCFPEAVGQPDPLHRADQGAKALGRQINDLVRSSVQRMRGNPLSWSFRDLRDQTRRK